MTSQRAKNCLHARAWHNNGFHPRIAEEECKKLGTFGGLSEKINLESSQWDRQSHVQSGLAKNTMILRALLVSTIAVMCVLIFYTLQNYNQSFVFQVYFLPKMIPELPPDAFLAFINNSGLHI